ncbi:MAG: Uma2 family endonuclease [Microcoleaceae cyanobacterium]
MIISDKTLIENLSLEDFLAIPETTPASEYIYGKIYQKPMPKGKHSLLQGRLNQTINQIGVPTKVAYSFPELRCSFNQRSIVADLVIFEWANIPLDDEGEISNEINIAPDWTIEILSPGQNTTRVINNILFCLKYGTKLGWLIDPQERLVLVFKPKQEPEIFEGEQVLPVLEVLKDLKISVNQLFSWLSFEF